MPLALFKSYFFVVSSFLKLTEQDQQKQGLESSKQMAQEYRNMIETERKDMVKDTPWAEDLPDLKQ